MRIEKVGVARVSSIFLYPTPPTIVDVDRRQQCRRSDQKWVAMSGCNIPF